MKKHTVIFLLVFLSGLTVDVFAQHDDEGKKNRIERLKSQKVAFLTEKIDLTSSEAQEFWPIYNEFSDKMESLHHNMKNNIKDLHKSLDSLSSSEKEAAIDRHVEYDLEKARLEKEYHQKFKEVLSIDKVIKLYEAEHEFKKKMLKLIRGGKGKSSSCDDDRIKLEEIV
ncbi:MAG: hypothetical protein R6U46_00605 [Marinilabilia sp.]